MTPSRRRLLAAAGATFAGGTAVSRAAAGSDGPSGPDGVPEPVPEWPMSRRGPAGTGAHPTASGPADDVELAWSHEATAWFRGTTAPILFDGTLYAAGDGLLALDPHDGSRRFGVPGSIRSTPAAVSTAVYRTATLAATGPTGLSGANAGGGVDLPLIGTRLGAERWRGPRSPGPGLFGSLAFVPPVADDGRVYAPVPGTDDVVGVDATSGAELWRDTHGDGGADINRPAVRDGRVFVTNWPHEATAYDGATGERRWHRRLADGLLLAPVATASGVVVPGRSSVWLLDPDDGATLWRRDLDGNATESTAAVADGTVFVADGDGSLHALDLATGESAWRVPFDGRDVAPVVADGVVYAVKRGYELVALDAATGERLFAYESTQAPLSTPVVGDGVVYAANRRRVIALEESR
ncbi:PQQ-binding-like beta-propeller repeat protein [Halobaculum lipolyticum]|uniref:PQQ-binding-like beta-propeller repeat protein n=1 Tax=Halobaculum lipolyticum TaxID=3032001 RepID=A0ABD5WA88_9EURY|nr:PQQ-binding-like beta-propeller repeat protein [Halobaculum sp. DT31]